MAIPVGCKCGKKFKVKDDLAGKAVRCPACGSALRIGGPPAAAGVSTQAPKGAATGGGDKADVDMALARYEDAQKKKQMTAEEEAAYREEQNKLIASYDQLTGRTAKPGEKKKKGELAQALPKQRTFLTKIADLLGILFGNLLAKYIIIVLLLGGGAVGSVYVVKYVTTYMHEESGPARPKEERIRDLFKRAQTALDAKDRVECERCLNEILRLDPSKEVHREFRGIREKLQKM